jgi:hypothetical protein
VRKPNPGENRRFAGRTDFTHPTRGSRSEDASRPLRCFLRSGGVQGSSLKPSRLAPADDCDGLDKRRFESSSSELGRLAPPTDAR